MKPIFPALARAGCPFLPGPSPSSPGRPHIPRGLDHPRFWDPPAGRHALTVSSFSAHEPRLATAAKLPGAGLLPMANHAPVHSHTVDKRPLCARAEDNHRHARLGGEPSLSSPKSRDVRRCPRGRPQVGRRDCASLPSVARHPGWQARKRSLMGCPETGGGGTTRYGVVGVSSSRWNL